MKNNRNILQNQKGASLVELLAVILIIVIASTIAFMNIKKPKTQLERQNVARELKVAFERARFDSVKRRAQGGRRANVVVSTNGFTTKTDLDSNGTIENSEDRLNTNWNSVISIRSQNGTALSGNVTVTFDNRGEATSANGPAVFLVCNGNCSTPAAENSNLVLVTATGTVNILSGSAAIPTFAAPNVSNVNANTAIRATTRVN